MKEIKRDQSLYIRCSSDFKRLLSLQAAAAGSSDADILHKALASFTMQSFRSDLEMIDLAKRISAVENSAQIKKQSKQIEREQKRKDQKQLRARILKNTLQSKYEKALAAWQKNKRFTSGGLVYSKKNTAAALKRLDLLQQRYLDFKP